MSNEKIGKKLEDYANKNIPREKEAFGQFMYHAELIKNGHWDVHYQDMDQIEPQYQEVMKMLCDKKDEPDMFQIAYEVMQ